MQIIRRAAVVASALTLVSALPAEAAHDRVRYAIVGEPRSLNPIFLEGAPFSIVSELIFEPLLRLGPGLRLEPALASEEPTQANGGISPDGKRITFRLRAGTRWSDGAPVTASDVAFTFEQAMNPKNNLGSRSGFDQIVSLSTPDPLTLVVQLKRPDAGALSVLEQQTALPRHLLSGFAELNRAPYNALPIGNGPYTVKRWVRGDRIVLEANPLYWRGAPRIETIEIHPVASAKSALLQLQTGEADLIQVPANYADQIPPGVPTARAPSLRWTQLTFNFANPVLRDRRVREALIRGIDRERLAQVAGHGLYVADRPMLPLFQWALDPGAVFPAYDPSVAARLLNEAGWIADTGGVRRRGSQALELTMIYRAGDDEVAPATVAAELAQIGVRIDLKAFPPGLLYATAADGGPLLGGRYDVAFIGLQTNPDPNPSWLFGCAQRPPVGFNSAGVCDAELDRALAADASTYDRAARVRALASAQRILVNEALFDPVYRVDQMWAYAGWLHGIRPSAYSPVWNVYEWSVSP
jgi:peptide/nickel transport system substrate-binding protein